MGAQNQSARPIETQLETLLFARCLLKYDFHFYFISFSFLMCFCQMFSRPIEGHLEILATALASASAFQCKYSFLHSINNLQSYKLLLYIFVKHVTYWLFIVDAYWLFIS